ncbi:hypothetical protein QGX12_gp071 [Pseudomonas phage Kremar]|uniref:Uncharacterized protein n=1 Tax=Pseudomonas phage Kremar TaxID=2928831 RepID=A0AAE9KEU1_9CAUD|nr:hypothetical protein QGX12_gp071 [Pseudomonas phage Kremar]UOL48573.1 hypothetical protein [Pseudomonas phage Kremar]
MITLVLFKIAATALVVFLIMLMVDSFCNYEDKAKGHYKTKVPAFVPYVGGTAGIVMVASVIASILMAIWA